MTLTDDLMNLGAGVGLGVLQTFLLRKYADVKYVDTDGEIIALKGFGKPSVIAGVGGGGLAAGYELNKAGKARMETEDFLAYGYGVGAVASGIISGVMPTEAAPPASRVRRVISGAQAIPQGQGRVVQYSQGGTAAVTTRGSV